MDSKIGDRLCGLVILVSMVVGFVCVIGGASRANSVSEFLLAFVPMTLMVIPIWIMTELENLK